MKNIQRKNAMDSYTVKLSTYTLYPENKQFIETKVAF
jgi:hypothetical protein